MPSGADPLEPPGWGLFAQWHALIDRGDPRFTFLAPVRDAAGPVAVMAADRRSTSWNMQRHWTVQNLRDGQELDARDRARGINARFILPRRVAEDRCPLASSRYDYLRLAPVAHPLMISDGRRILVGDATGEGVYTSTDPGVVARAVDFFERLWQNAQPAVPEGEQPPFTPRMLQIAYRLVDGATDRQIAGALGVSERTVSADVRAMSNRLGARSRAHAISLISGVDG